MKKITLTLTLITILISLMSFGQNKTSWQLGTIKILDNYYIVIGTDTIGTISSSGDKLNCTNLVTLNSYITEYERLNISKLLKSNCSIAFIEDFKPNTIMYNKNADDVSKYIDSRNMAGQHLIKSGKQRNLSFILAAIGGTISGVMILNGTKNANLDVINAGIVFGTGTSILCVGLNISSNINLRKAGTYLLE